MLTRENDTREPVSTSDLPHDDHGREFKLEDASAAPRKKSRSTYQNIGNEENAANERASASVDATEDGEDVQSDN